MISIIIPAYNEGDRIGLSLEKLAAFLKGRSEAFEVIVVDDASTDDTQQVAESFKGKIANLTVLRLEKNPLAGKGYAINKGVLASKGDIVLFTDSDFSTPIEEIDKLLEKLNSGYDIAIGSRAADRSTVKEQQGAMRQLMGRTFNLFVQIFTVRGIKDTQCGFKAFKMPQSRSLFEEQKIFDFGFDVELLFAAQKKDLKIAEVPTLWYNDARSTVNPIVDSAKMFWDLIKIRLYHGTLSGSLADKLYYLVYHYRTFWRFSIVGVSNTIVDYGLFYILTRSFGLDKLTANPISVETAIIWSFIWNNLWTFSERRTESSLIKRFLIFQFVSLGGLLVSQTSLLVFFRYLGIEDLVAKAITIPIVLVFNFLLNSRWTFRENKGKSAWYVYTVFIIFLALIYIFLGGKIPTFFF